MKNLSNKTFSKRIYKFAIAILLFVLPTSLNSQCNHTISFFDTFGDGWNGCSVTVSVNGSPVYTNITLAAGSGPENFSFAVNHGDAISVFFSAGSYPGECYFDISNDNGYLLLNDYYPNTSGNWNGSADCNSTTGITYCTSNATSSSDSEIDFVGLSGNSVNISNNTAGFCATYSDFTGLSAADLSIGSTYSLTVTAGTCGDDYSKSISAFIDWNQDGDFDDSNESIGFDGPIAGTGSYSFSFTVPAGATSGTTRLRVVLQENLTPSSILACGTYTYGETEDYSISVENAVNMSFVSCTSSQINTGDVSIGSINEEIIRIEIVTSGNLSPLSVSELRLRTDGCDDYSVDIADAKIWYTGTNPTFNVTGQFGSTVVAPTAPGTNMVFSGSQTLATGTNYFWLTYSIPVGATDGNYIDGKFQSVVINGSTYNPTISEPAGERMIIDGCYHTLNLFDSGGNGWEGGTITVKVNGSNVLTNQTLAAGSSSTITFVAKTNDVIETFYTAGANSAQNRFLITNPNGAYILSSGDDNQTPVNTTGTADCEAIMEFSVNGTSYQSGTSCYIITENLEDQSGSVWSNFKVDLTNDFSIAFDIFLGDESGSEGADGAVFCLQGDCASAGGAGGSMGYGGINGSVAVEFDTYRNYDENGDPFDGEDHLAIISNGNVNHWAATNLAGPAAVSELEDNDWHSAVVSWNNASSTLSVSFDGTPLLSYSGDIINDIFAGNTQVFWGFTAGTGLYYNRQEVCVTSYPQNSTQISDTTICDGCSLGVAVSTGASSYSWTPDDGSISNPNIYNPVLTPDVSTEYTVEIIDACGNVLTDRFTVNVGFLPVEFMSFSGNCNNGNMELDWVTASEINNDYFDILKSLDGKNWNSIGRIAGAGNSSESIRYRFTDYNFKLSAFYKIMQVDYDGTIDYSRIISPDCKENTNSITLFPNPAKNTLFLENIQGEEMTIEITNSIGQTFNSTLINNQIDISFFVSGVYLVKIIDSEGTTIKTERLIIL
ncbi:MAG: T9SS type A sorting domain-containing protein [Bacteroidales bacterium]|nr:T9SS type A sorting domain-containing protein [Bacteroidales bacterium]